VKEKAKPGGRLTARQRARNHRFGKVCAEVEHIFRVVKRQFGYRKVRYRGIAKNGAQVFSLLALANLCMSPAGHLWLAALTRKSSLKPQTIASPR
jgi:IS5 family transposase